MKPDFSKSELLPAIVQHASNSQILMLGYMNEDAYTRTLESGRVTFFSRSRKRLWVKGETSGNFLEVRSVAVDCDQDTVLVKAHPLGPTCHRGTTTCFDSEEADNKSAECFLFELEELIAERRHVEQEVSYTAGLLQAGVEEVAQKVGEEAVEVVIEAVKGDTESLKEEVADLLFHVLVLLRKRGVSLSEIEEVLRGRNQQV